MCPTTKQFKYDKYGTQNDMPGIYTAWGVYSTNNTGLSLEQLGRNGLNGSYGINGYILEIQGQTYEGGVDKSDGWSNFNAMKETSKIPLMTEAIRFDQWPLHTEGPAETEEAAWSSNNMGRVCINRHRGFGCASFADGHARKVGLKELWTLKWHKKFNTSGPWTLAGGATAEKWPEWIRKYPTY
jgi:hypothetical protein